MDDPRLVWRLGRWIAGRVDGAARLGWSQGEVILRLRDGRIVSVEGVDPAALAARLGCEPTGKRDLLAEAGALARAHGLPVTQAVGTAKELVQQALAEWYRDPARQLELVEGSPEPSDKANISITHAVVELILSDTSGRLAAQVLPDPATSLRRTDRFLELYAPLRLSEEADLIVAKISGRRTAAEVAASSSHGAAEVNRLLAALVATGMLEPSPPSGERPATPEAVSVQLTDDVEDAGVRRLRIPVVWIGVAAAVLIAFLVVLAMLGSDDEKPTEPAVAGASWSLVVDMGCEQAELQRVLKKAREHPDLVRPVRADAEEGGPCWRLVWGSFPSQEAAAQAIDDIPPLLRQSGFSPHPIQVPEDESAGGGDLPGE